MANMQALMKRMNAAYRQPTMSRGGRGKASPAKSFAQPSVAGTPGATNPSSSVRSRTLRQGKSVVPAKAKTPRKTKQLNPKGRRSVKSTPVGYKKPGVGKSAAGLKGLGVPGKKGGTAMTRKAITRGGMGATRPNFGQTARSTPLGAIGGRGK